MAHALCAALGVEAVEPEEVIRVIIWQDNDPECPAKSVWTSRKVRRARVAWNRWRRANRRIRYEGATCTCGCGQVEYDEYNIDRWNADTAFGLLEPSERWMISRRHTATLRKALSKERAELLAVTLEPSEF